MNRRGEVVLEGIIADLTYRLSLPGTSSFENAYLFLAQAREELQSMEAAAMSNKPADGSSVQPQS